ncbi:TRAP transporter large permease [Corynebacterium pseudodiphtheriticum]|uniref:TRAP transporter large permease n=1 Tax=Corynebacterium pseudodiphtheriticum TaxID=37637 RepID=UPI0020BE6B3E|nr:TRAP transporter large permease [Corynebacterium pseudodiphtheriticum]UQV53749.1 TRAP transporter large permease [Corynebacterium pseudodiphtheriticum]
MILLAMLAALLILLALRVPVAFALLIPSLVYILFEPNTTISVASQQATSGVFDFAILAVPMFILLGNLANISGATDKMYDAAVALIGHLRGSLGYVNIATSFGFSWISGAAIADAAAMGRVQVPAMVERKYSPEFSLGITGASSLVAPMMPPSIPAIIYAVTAGVSISALFAAGIIPALIIVLGLVVMVWYLTRNDDDLRMPKASAKDRVKLSIKALPMAGAAIIVLGGILSGIFTPTEASAIGVIYVAVLAIVYKNFNFRNIRDVLVNSVETTGSILLIVASASLFGWVLAREQAPQIFGQLIFEITDKPLFFLIIVNIVLLIVGAVLEPTSAILVMTPVLIPLGEAYGLDPVHMGTMMIFNLMIGLLTPPVGLVLFVLSSVTKYPVTQVIRGTVPFFVPMLVTLFAVAFIPPLTLWLPHVVGII